MQQFAIPQLAIPQFAIPQFAIPQFAIPQFAFPQFAIPQYQHQYRYQLHYLIISSPWNIFKNRPKMQNSGIAETPFR
jgi:hypothetical protein